METSAAYKSNGGNKFTKGAGYEDAKGINERFSDLAKASEGAPKIQKPSINTVLKSADF